MMVLKLCLKRGGKWNTANGYGLGSMNSITEYVPFEGFRDMIDAVNEIRKVK